MKAALFQLGQVVATKDVSENLTSTFIQNLLARHVTGDYGDLCKEDIEANEQALKDGERILSSFESSHGKLYIITEWDRSHTTILFADEY